MSSTAHIFPVYLIKTTHDQSKKLNWIARNKSRCGMQRAKVSSTIIESTFIAVMLRALFSGIFYWIVRFGAFP